VLLRKFQTCYFIPASYDLLTGGTFNSTKKYSCAQNDYTQTPNFMTSFTKQVGENIRLCRVLRKLSQENVADIIGITVTAFGKIERGESNTTVTRIKKISEALSVLPEDLVKSADFNLEGSELMPLLKKVSAGINLLIEKKQMPDN